MNNNNRYRLGELLRETGAVGSQQLDSAMSEQRRTGEALGRILVKSGAIGKQQLYRALVMQRCLRAASLSCALMAAPMTAMADSADAANGQFVDVSKAITMPSADRPALNDAEPISVPVKAFVERIAYGKSPDSYSRQRFSYNIDALQQGAAFRMNFKF